MGGGAVMHKLIVPTVNLNGNTARDLVAQLRHVMHAIADTQQALTQASDVVHGRNFQLAEEPREQQYAAQRAWSERYALLETMHADMLALAVAIQNQEKRK
jgi:hypothetical protein